jgi:hypothetical protein
MTVGAADVAKVRAMMEWLVSRYEEYVSEHGTQYLDAFMGTHNFHKAIVLDLVERCEESRDGKRMLLLTAKGTWDDMIDAELRKLAD